MCSSDLSALELLELPSDRPTLRTPGVPSAAGVFPRHAIRLQDAWYRYPSSEEWVLRGVSLDGSKAEKAATPETQEES